MSARTTLASCLAAVLVVTVVAPEADAQTVIKSPNDHPDYRAELEPHAVFGLWHRRYYGHYNHTPFRDPELGVGFRATIEVADPAFIPKLNNTVGITFGLDISNCQFCRGREDFRLYTPIGLQWNFFITRKFSAFADLGFMLSTDGFYQHVYPDFFGMLGGRYHFNDDVAFTFRIGVPFVTVGVSFFVG